MENQIKQILAGTDYTAKTISGLWQIRVGNHAGARKDGVSLAQFLLTKHKIDIQRQPEVSGKSEAISRKLPAAEIAHPEPVSVSGEAMRGAVQEVELPPAPPTPEIVEKVIENPETQERLAEALRKLSEAEAKLAAKKADADIPPPEIADLIRLNETYEQANLRLVEEYRQAMQKAELARTRDGIFEGQSTTFWLRKAERYDSAIQWNRGRGVETTE